MIIENIRFYILSRGENHPEKFPKIGDNFYLSIQSFLDGEIMTANITAERIEPMGHYSHVIGKTTIQTLGENPLRCDAKFETGVNYPLRARIGQLVLKKFT